MGSAQFFNGLGRRVFIKDLLDGVGRFGWDFGMAISEILAWAWQGCSGKEGKRSIGGILLHFELTIFIDSNNSIEAPHFGCMVSTGSADLSFGSVVLHSENTVFMPWDFKDN